MRALDHVAAADAAWAAQLGPALSEPDVARLLDWDIREVVRSLGLLRLQQRETGERVYPLFQFTSDGPTFRRGPAGRGHPSGRC